MYTFTARQAKRLLRRRKNWQAVAYSLYGNPYPAPAIPPVTGQAKKRQHNFLPAGETGYHWLYTLAWPGGGVVLPNRCPRCGRVHTMAEFRGNREQ